MPEVLFRRVVVSGAGIAGLTCAIALRKAGIDVLVVEARPASDAGAGVFLTLAANGLDGLRTLGLEPDRLGGFDTRRIGLYLSDGTRLTEFPTAPARRDGLVAQTVRRTDLYAALRHRALQLGAEIRYDCRLTDADTMADGVEVVLENGTAVRATVLVAADGVHSRVRQIVDPQAPQPQITDLMNTGGIARGVPVEGEPGTMRMYFGRRCFFAYVPRGNGEVWWFANPPASAHTDNARLQDWKHRLADMFVSDESPARELILATADVSAPWATYELPHVPVWHRGRMVLSGDAAHAASPSSGQGASMAIEDAIQLARCIRDHSSVDAALDRYEHLRRGRVQKVVKQGRHNSGGKAPGPLGRIIRDALLKVRFRVGTVHVENLRWLYDHHIEWTEPSMPQSRRAQ